MFPFEMKKLDTGKYFKLPYFRFDKYLVSYHCAIPNCKLEWRAAKSYQNEFERLTLASEQTQTFKSLKNVAITTVIYQVERVKAKFLRFR